MTATELKEALKHLGWSQAELARRIAVDKNTVTRWMKKNSVPGGAAAYVKLKVKLKNLEE